MFRSNLKEFLVWLLHWSHLTYMMLAFGMAPQSPSLALVKPKKTSNRWAFCPEMMWMLMKEHLPWYDSDAHERVFALLWLGCSWKSICPDMTWMLMKERLPWYDLDAHETSWKQPTKSTRLNIQYESQTWIYPFIILYCVQFKVGEYLSVHLLLG